MSIVVTTPTGKIGSQVSSILLDRGREVTVIARDPAKVAGLAARGARVVEGSHADTSVLVDATKGASALFLITPPDFSTQDLRATYRRFGLAAMAAIRENGIGHVLHLSSVGADRESGNGPVAGLHVNEQILSDTAAHVTNLRPAYFMENTMGQIPMIRQMGSLFTTFEGTTRFPMIATRDIAARATEILGSLDWTGKRVVELHGAADVSYDDVASILSEVLGRPIAHVTVSEERSLAALAGMGLSAHLAGSFNELTRAIESGHVRFLEERSTANMTPTTYRTFASEVFRKAFEA